MFLPQEELNTASQDAGQSEWRVCGQEGTEGNPLNGSGQWMVCVGWEKQGGEEHTDLE